MRPLAQLGMAPNMAMGHPQMVNPMGSMNGAALGLNPGGAGFNPALANPPHPNAGQMESGQLQQRLHQQQQWNQMRQRAMDMREFPRPVLANIGISVPQGILSWGKLKAHIVQNQAVLPPNRQIVHQQLALQRVLDPKKVLLPLVRSSPVGVPWVTSPNWKLPEEKRG